MQMVFNEEYWLTNIMGQFFGLQIFLRNAYSFFYELWDSDDIYSFWWLNGGNNELWNALAITF